MILLAWAFSCGDRFCSWAHCWAEERRLRICGSTAAAPDGDCEVAMRLFTCVGGGRGVEIQ